jgi:hypothetical protein
MSETNDFGGVIWTGLKVSLYNNAGGEAVNVKTITIPGACYSEILYNPKSAPLQ